MKKCLILITLLFVFQSANTQEIFHSEYFNHNSSYENFSDLNTYKTFVQLSMCSDNSFKWQSEVFYNEKNQKVRVRCLETKGTWIKNKDTLILNMGNLVMRYIVSKNGKKLFNLEEDPKYAKNNKLKKVKSPKSFVCNSN